MTAFETVSLALRERFLSSLGVDTLKAIEDTVCVVLGSYNITEKEDAIVVYDGGDQRTLQKFFLSKAIQGCTEKTIATYSNVLAAFFRTVKKHIAEVTADDIRLYLAQKKINKASDAYLCIIYRALSSFYSWCATEDVVIKNPILRVEKIKIHKKVEPALTEEEMEALRYAAKTKREKALVEFLYSTGCRISEVCALNREDIDFDTMEITVLGKGKKYRTVYLSQRAKFALKDYLDSRTDKSPALFGYDFSRLIGGLKEYRKNTMGEDGRLLPDEARSIIKKIGKRADLKVHPHLLRKTVATLALRRGMPIDQVKSMLGHENISTTQIYAQTDDVQVKQAHEKYV